MSLRQDEAGSFLVVEAILVAVLILTAILFFTSVQRPLAGSEERGIDLGQVATDSLGILQRRDFGDTAPTDPEGWVAKVVGGDTAKAQNVDDFVSQVLPAGTKHFVRLSNGIGTLNLLPTTSPGLPRGARAAEIPLFTHWQPGASNPLPTAAASYIVPGMPVASGTTAYSFTDPASLVKCIKGPNGSTVGPSGAAWASSTYWQKTLGQVPAWALYGVWQGYSIDCTTAQGSIAVTLPGATTLASTLASSTTVSCTGAGDCVQSMVGRLVFGTGIPAGAYVTAVDTPGAHLTLSAAATRFVVVNGPGAAAQPISWAITARSTTPRPLTLPPPLASLTSSEVQPSSAPRFQ